MDMHNNAYRASLWKKVTELHFALTTVPLSQKMQLADPTNVAINLSFADWLTILAMAVLIAWIAVDAINRKKGL
jgi:hypothetical protein